MLKQLPNSSLESMEFWGNETIVCDNEIFVLPLDFIFSPHFLLQWRYSMGLDCLNALLRKNAWFKEDPSILSLGLGAETNLPICEMGDQHFWSLLSSKSVSGKLSSFGTESASLLVCLCGSIFISLQLTSRDSSGLFTYLANRSAIVPHFPAQGWTRSKTALGLTEKKISEHTVQPRYYVYS